MFREVGFEGVEEKEYRIPIGNWMALESEKMGEVGEKFLQCLKWGMVGFSKTVLMRGLGWTEEQVEEVCREAVADLGNGRLYATVRFVMARKPASAGDGLADGLV